MGKGYVDYINDLNFEENDVLGGKYNNTQERTNLKLSMVDAKIKSEAPSLVFYRHYIAWLSNVCKEKSCTAAELLAQLALINQYVTELMMKSNDAGFETDCFPPANKNQPEAVVKKSFEDSIAIQKKIDDRIKQYYQKIARGFLVGERAFVAAAVGLLFVALGIVLSSDLLFTKVVVPAGVGIGFGCSLVAAWLCNVVSEHLKQKTNDDRSFIETWLKDSKESRVKIRQEHVEDSDCGYYKNVYEKEIVDVPAHLSSKEGVNWFAFKIKQKAKETVVSETLTVDKLNSVFETQGYGTNGIEPALKAISEEASLSGVYTSYHDYKNGRGLLSDPSLQAINLQKLSTKLKI